MENFCRKVPARIAFLLPVLFLSACSYLLESAIQDVLVGSAEAPVFLGYKAVSEWELDFEFSLPVRVVALNFDPPAEIESIGEGTTVTVNLSRPLGLGEQVVADLLVEDEAENTLNVLVPFRARNDRMPRVLINELRTEYSKPKVEFVELRTESAGNLGALRLYIASNGLAEPIFEFPPVEVPEGEYIVVHLRTVEEGCVNETGEALDLSKGTEALATARDFWIPGSVKRLKKTDAVYLLDQDDRIIDAVLLSENPDAWWTKQEFAECAERFGQEGAWVAAGGPAGTVPGPADAVYTKFATATRTISRDEAAGNSHSTSDWYITDTSNATPGKQNSTKKYVPK
jgi:hypothetical protein